MNLRSASVSGVGNVPLGIALCESSKTHRETRALRMFATNSSPQGLKSTPIGAERPLPVMTPLGHALPSESRTNRDTELLPKFDVNSSPQGLKTMPLGTVELRPISL